MNPVDVHPEELLDRELAGRLTDEERMRLDAHSASCVACALVRRGSRDFEIERRSAGGDPITLERIAAGALASLAPVAAPPASRKSFVVPRRRRRRAWAVAAVVMFAATGATASFWSVRHVIVSRLLASPTWSPTPAAEPKPAAPARIAAHQPATEPAPTQAPIAAPAQPVRVAPSAPARPKVVEEPAPLTADQLFSTANDARRHGDSAQAVKLYRQLQQQFPGTREEAMSRVALARLLLDRGEDPAQALSLFARYLAESPSGTLAEEARLGKALALQRLGRAQDERQAWQELLALFPNSVQAERARRRLEELR
jgi:TolA-binding protein